MRAISALIIDDEQLDRELLSNLILDYCTSIVVQGEVAEVMEAEQYILQHQPNVVFLDIHMPGGNGFNLLERFPKKNFHTVITTGYPEYGIKAVKAGALDYLLKPLDVDELLLTEQKLLTAINPQKTSGKQLLQVYDKGMHVMIDTTDIVCLKAEGSYVRIFLANAPSILTAKNIKQVIPELPINEFVRVHRSYVINTRHVVSYYTSGNDWVIQLSGSLAARVSRQYKPLIKKILAL